MEATFYPLKERPELGYVASGGDDRTEEDWRSPFDRNVLRTFNLDCNAVAMDLRTGLVLDGGPVKAIRQKKS